MDTMDQSLHYLKDSISNNIYYKDEIDRIFYDSVYFFCCGHILQHRSNKIKLQSGLRAQKNGNEKENEKKIK